MKMVETEKLKLEAEKGQISQVMAQLQKVEENNDVVQSRVILKKRGREVRDALRKITKQWLDLENTVMLKALTLPNDLDKNTPVEKSELLDSAGQVKVSDDVRSHIEICKQFDLAKFSSVGPKAYYFKNDLAMTVQTLISSVNNYLTGHGFSHIAAPEMFRSRVAEGCGVDIQNSQELYKLYDRDAVNDTESKSHQLLDMLHLRGASLVSFAGYLTKMNTDRETLPLRMFSVGTHYQPQCDLPGLFGALQSTKAVLFSGSECDTSSAEEFDKMKSLIWNMYKSMGFPVRLVCSPGSELHVAESKRVEVQMWAPGIEQFVQVAFASQYKDYVSRRLCCLHSVNIGDHKLGQHIHMVHGQAMDMTRMIACALEHGSVQQGSWKLPEIPIPSGPITD
ncbi:serine--tRNA ligase, mitochondrial-like [Gigantopelta aegis]|uniref:serine--tRNA ligase, mitochondrial-like n=1 Tax=Gigantopelta aegis TaxID=1735272 RepID=UPI001B88AA93|nr:serine--tRNA ligase, mitochondrial-like [Gigantopelta aegis]